MPSVVVHLCISWIGNIKKRRGLPPVVFLPAGLKGSAPERLRVAAKLCSCSRDNHYPQVIWLRKLSIARIC